MELPAPPGGDAAQCVTIRRLILLNEIVILVIDERSKSTSERSAKPAMSNATLTWPSPGDKAAKTEQGLRPCSLRIHGGRLWGAANLRFGYGIACGNLTGFAPRALVSAMTAPC